MFGAPSTNLSDLEGYSDFEDLSSASESDMSSVTLSSRIATPVPSIPCSSPLPNSPNTFKRDSAWCFGKNITLRTADEVRFCIPKDLLLLPNDEGSRLALLIERAISDGTYLVQLNDVQSKVLELYLSLRFPRDLEQGDIHTVTDWTTLLRFATDFDLTTVRNLAIKRLSAIASPVDKLVEAAHSNVKEWIVPCFVELCMRPKFLTLEEGLRLGARDLHFIASSREEMQGRYPMPILHEQEVLGLVREKLGLPADTRPQPFDQYSQPASDLAGGAVPVPHEPTILMAASNEPDATPAIGHQPAVTSIADAQREPALVPNSIALESPSPTSSAVPVPVTATAISTPSMTPAVDPRPTCAAVADPINASTPSTTRPETANDANEATSEGQKFDKDDGGSTTTVKRKKMTLQQQRARRRKLASMSSFLDQSE